MANRRRKQLRLSDLVRAVSQFSRNDLEASLAVDPSHSAYVQLGRLLERIGKPEEASRVYRQGLELSLGQLKETTGGRRRAAL